MALTDLVNEATAAALDVRYREARAARLKAATVAEAERLRLAGAPVRELTSDQGLGSLRLDGEGRPVAPAIQKQDEVDGWLAQVEPSLVEALISVPPGRLAEALDILEFHGFTTREVSSRVTSRDLKATLAWLAAHCRIQPDPQIPRAWNVLHQDNEGHLTPVPGVTAVKPAPYWVVTTNDDRRKDYVATAESEVEELVRQLRQQDDLERSARDADRKDLRDDLAELEDPPRSSIEGGGGDRLDAAYPSLPRGIAGPMMARFQALSRGVDEALAKREDLLALTRPEVAALCRERGESTKGSKEALVDRLLIADGLVSPAPGASD